MKKTTAISIFLILFFLALTNTVFAQISNAEIDALVERAMKEFNVAGVAVAVVKDGKIIHEKGYGVKSVDTKQAVNEFTDFQIASNSKAFTTAALAILVEEGKISWKDKVKTHIPEFKMYNEYVTENFLVEDLLTHRSGLGLGVGDLMTFPDGADFTIKDVLNSFQYFKSVSAFRTQFDYDNQLYIVAGEVIARVSGMSWEKFVQTRIMQPLKMDNSAASYATVKDKNNVAIPHTTESDKLRTTPLFENPLTGAAGGIFSNARDMSKWMLVHLNKGKYGNDLEKQLFTEKSQREMWKIHTVMDKNWIHSAFSNPRYGSHFNGYGLGWFLSDVKGNLSVSHSGGLPGMISVVTMIPDQKLGIVILTNTEPGGGAVYSAVSQTMLDRYLGLSDFDWIENYSKIIKAQQNNQDTVTQKVWETVAAAKNTPVKTENFVGVYEDKWFGKVEIFLKGGQLWFKSLRSPKLNGAMQFYKANTFAIKWEYQDMNADAFAMFALDEEGKAQSIKMKGISPNIDFSFDFQDLDFQRMK